MRLIAAQICLHAAMTGARLAAPLLALQQGFSAAADATQLKRVFSWLAISPAAANFVGPFAAGLLIDHAGPTPGHLTGFRVAFGLLALLPLAGWLLARATAEQPQVRAAPGAAPPRAWDLLGNPMFRRLLFVNWLQAAAWDVHTFVLPILGHERGLSASMIGGVLGAFAVAAAAIRVLLPVVASRVSERSVIAASNVVTAGVFACYPLMSTALGMGLCSVVLGVALGAVQPMVMSMLHQITPHARHGEALGLRVMTINASSVAMPMLFGAAGAIIGIGGLFWLVGAVVAAGTRSVWRLEAPPEEPHGPQR
ncbi:MAG: MFS transporter [Comamonadaceae bacterium]|nr:MAG: MFS transporter [Comamonadaceae bacterium]